MPMKFASRFPSLDGRFGQKTEADRAAYAALSKADDAGRVVARLYSERAEQSQLEEGWKPIESRRASKVLFGDPEFVSKHCGTWADHAHAWMKDGVIELLCEPYNVNLEEMSDLVKACTEHGLSLSVSAGGAMWFPGWTVCFVIRKQEDAPIYPFYPGIDTDKVET